MHEACLYGANEIVEYLLQKGFNPNAKDGQGDTPLHRVVVREVNTSLILLLKQYKANLNIKNHNEFTPLFMAILFKNSAATLELIKQGAKKDLKCMGLNYIQFRQEVGKGNIENTSPGVNLSSPQEDIAEQAVANYYKGCLLPYFNQQIFQEVKAWLVKKPGGLNKNECCCLIDALILTSKTPFQPQILITELSKLIQSGKITTDFVVFGILKASRAFAEQHQVEVVTELNEFALSRLDPKEISNEEIVNFYYMLGNLYKQIGLFLKSEYCLQQAIGKFPEQRANKDKMEVWFNLGCTKAFLMKEKEALESFKNAFYFDPKDEETFQRYLTLLLKFQDYEEALKICDQSEFGEYSKICTAYVRTLTGDSSWLDLLKIVDAKFVSRSANIMALDLKAICYIRLRDHDQAVISAEQSFALTEKNFKEDVNINIATEIFKILNICIQAGKYELGLSLVERFEKEYPLEFGYSVLCNSAASVLYLANQQVDKAEVLIQKIRSLGANPDMLSHFYLSLALEILSNRNDTSYDMAMKYIDLALEIDPNNLKGQLYKLLLSVLRKDQKTTENILQSIEPELFTDISVVKDLLKEEEPILSENPPTHVVDTSEIDNRQEKDEFIPEEQTNLEMEKYDPVKIHHFFQAEKARLLNETINILSPNPKPKVKWKVGPVCFKEGMNGLIRIQHPRFSNCYAVIHPHLNPPFLEKFENALSKSNYDQMDLSEDTSKVSRKRNSNVQTLNNCIVQLKIHEDDRLWTDKVYCVDGKHLIVFDHHDRHPAVKRKAREGTEIKVIDPLEQQLSLLNPGNISGVFVPPPEGINLENKQPIDVTNTLQM